jgi:hypothetical protein
MPDGESRRDALKIIGAIGTTCAFPFAADELYGQSAQHVHTLVQVEQAAQALPRFFTESELKLVSRIADLIIPATDTPGAVAAGVPAYIDAVVGANERHQRTYRDGLAYLDKLSRDRHQVAFLELDETRQIELLTPLSDAVDEGTVNSTGERFFAAIKNMTADGFYTSKAGLIQELGYKGNTVMGEFPGCTHEH